MVLNSLFDLSARRPEGFYSYVLFFLGLLLFVNILNAGELHDAAEKGDIDNVRKLIKNNANINARDDQGATPLIWAAAYGKAEVVKYLVSRGAALDSTTKDGITALMIAVEYGEKEVVSVLLNAGANVNRQEPSGYSALMIAVAKDNLAIIKRLVKHGADVNLRLPEGGTALFKASARGNKQIVDYLLKNGADPDLYYKRSDSPPRSALLVAAWNKSADHQRYKSVIKSLLKHDAKDDWLSSVPGFDPYEFSQLTLGLNKKGVVTVGSIPFFPGQHYAARPSVDKSAKTSPGMVSGIIGSGGTNFLSWSDKQKGKGMVTVVIINDDKKNTILAQLLPPAFIGKGGVVYRDHVSSIKSKGPFATINVSWKKRPASGSAFIKRGGKSLKLNFNKEGEASYILKKVNSNEPVEIVFKDNDKHLKSVDMDCVIRGATQNSASYAINYSQ